MLRSWKLMQAAQESRRIFEHYPWRPKFQALHNRAFLQFANVDRLSFQLSVSLLPRLVCILLLCCNSPAFKACDNFDQLSCGTFQIKGRNGIVVHSTLMTAVYCLFSTIARFYLALSFSYNLTKEIRRNKIGRSATSYWIFSSVTENSNHLLSLTWGQT